MTMTIAVARVLIVLQYQDMGIMVSGDDEK